jgi:hypothetical protein
LRKHHQRLAQKAKESSEWEDIFTYIVKPRRMAVRNHRKRQLVAKILAMQKFSIKSIMATAQVSRNLITYVQRLMKTEAGQDLLFGKPPTPNRTFVMRSHVAAVKWLMRHHHQAYQSVEMLHADLEAKYPSLP